MNSEYSEQENSLRQKVESSERALGELERELRTVNAELEGLAEKHHQFELLTQACSSLEELQELGAAHLFWDEGQDTGDTASHLAHARSNIDEFTEEVTRVEERREALVGQVGSQNSELDVLHYDMQDLIEKEEKQKNEWIVERDPSELPGRTQIMPWTRGGEEDKRLNRSMLTSLAASIAVALILSMIAIPVLDEPDEIELPERVARLVRQERLPPPPPPTPEPEVPEEPVEPEPELVEESEPEPVPEDIQEPVLAKVEQPSPKEQVKSKGILAFRDDFASRADVRPSAQLGSQARLSNAGAESVGRPERMMVTSNAPGSSGGINLADISRDFGGGGGGGGGGMEGVAVSRVASSIGGGDGPARPLSGGAFAGRTDEEIQIVFDRYKAALYRLYNRELRKDPTLRGQLVLQLTIEPNGTVSLCKLHSTSMNAPLLADQVVNRVSTFDFGAKEDIVAVTIIYPIDFLPAA